MVTGPLIQAVKSTYYQWQSFVPIGGRAVELVSGESWTPPSLHFIPDGI